MPNAEPICTCAIFKSHRWCKHTYPAERIGERLRTHYRRLSDEPHPDWRERVAKHEEEWAKFMASPVGKRYRSMRAKVNLILGSALEALDK